MLNTSFSPWPAFTTEETDMVSRVLQSNRVNYWTGDEGRAFEREFAEFADSRYAIAVSNGTFALEMALKALGISSGDEVLVTSRSFLASASSIILAGAIPVFVDVDRDSQNISLEGIAGALTANTKAIIAVHLAGWPCEMEAIMKIADEHGLFVVEDCAQAHGAKYREKSVGSIGHIGCWSFCQDKIMSTGGEGGMVTTNSRELWSKMWSFKDHGKSWKKVYEQEKQAGFRWLHESFGTNGRMTEMQAAIGRIQLKRMPAWKARRQSNSAVIESTCRNISSLRVTKVPEHVEHARYKYYVFVRPEKLKNNWDRNRIMNEINRLGVPCYQGSCSEIYLEKAFEGTKYRPKERLAVASELAETSLMFLVHPTLTDHEIKRTCEAIETTMMTASR